MPQNPLIVPPGGPANKPKLTLADFQRAATRLNVDVATIRAVTTVESGGTGFMADGKCVIRFEPHLFSRFTKGIYDKAHPTFSFPVWKPGYPVSVRQSWELFAKAAALNPNAAVMATSFGLFQVLGSNFVSSGCTTLGEFVRRMEESEGQQLDMFVNLILDWGLDDELQERNWAGFARIFNGKLFKINRYDTRLAEAYARFSRVLPA